MNTNTLRQELHTFLEVAEDEKIKSLSMVEEEIKGTMSEYSDEFKRKLDDRLKSYNQDKTRIVTPSQSQERINQKLKN